MKVFEEMITALKTLNIPVADNIEFKVVDKFPKRSTLGNCSQRETKFIIRVRSDLSDSIFRSTIAHELIHTCPGCFNHRSKFKRYASKVNKALGLKCGYHEVGPQNLEKYKYVIRCKCCGTLGAYNRLNNKLKMIALGLPGIKCAKCYGNQFEFVNGSGNAKKLKEDFEEEL